MNRFILLVPLISCLTLTSWGQSVIRSTHSSNQVVQGPCYIFATVAALESRALQNSSLNLSANDVNFNEWQFYSRCALGSRSSSGSVMVSKSLLHMKNYGASKGGHNSPTAGTCPNPNDPLVPCIADFDCSMTSTWCQTNGTYQYTADNVPCEDDNNTNFEIFGGGAHQYKLVPDANGNLYHLETNPTASKIATALSNGHGVIAFFDDWNNTGISHAVFIYSKSGNTYSYKDSWPGSPSASRSSSLDINKCTRFYYITGTVVGTSAAPTPCQYTISGASSVPSSGTRTFTLSGGNGSLSNITWSVPSGTSIVSGQGTSTLVVRSTRCNNGSGTLTVSYSNNGSSCSKTKGLTVYGSGSATPSRIAVLNPNWNIQGQTCPNITLELEAIDHNNPLSGTTYDWVISGATILSGQGTSTLYIRTFSNSFSYQDYQVRAKKNGCQWSGWRYLSGTASSSYCGGGGGGVAFRQVRATPQQLDFTPYFHEIGARNGVVSVQVMSLTGQVLADQKMSMYSPQLSFLEMPAGIVVIRMYQEETGAYRTFRHWIEP